MKSLIVNAAHLIAAAAGFWAILRYGPRFAEALWFRAAVAAGALCMAIFVFMACEPAGLFEDFIRAYLEGGRAALAGGEGWSALYARGVDGFVNLPIFAYLFAPFALFGDRAAALLFFAAGIAATLWAWRLLGRLYQFTPTQNLLALFAFGAFGPLLYSFREGNISHLLLPVMLWALADLRVGRDLRAGVLFGLLTLIKPLLGLVCAYFLLRRKWRAAAGAAATGVIVIAASVLFLGLPLHLEWYEASIAPFAAGPIPGFNAQSIASMLARFETGIPGYLVWEPHALSAVSRALVLLSSAALLGAFAWICLRRKLSEAMDLDREIALLLILACLISTLSWSHYFVWAAPGFALLLKQPLPGRFQYWPLIAGFALLAPAEFAGGPLGGGRFGPLSNFVASHMTLGALILIAALFMQRRESAIQPANP